MCGEEEEETPQETQEAPTTREHNAEDEPMTVQQSSTMSRPFSLRPVLIAALLALGAWLLPAATAQAAAPSWKVTVSPVGGGYFNPGANGNASDGPGFLTTVTNEGTGPTVGAYKIKNTLPAGLTAAVGEVNGEDQNGNTLTCVTVAQVVTCEGTAPVGAAEQVEVIIPVNVADKETLESLKVLKGTDEVTVEGGGAALASGKSPVVFLTNNRPAWQILTMFQTNPLGGGNTAWNGVEYGQNGLYFETANIGGAPTQGTITITFTFSPGVTVRPSGGIIFQSGFYQAVREEVPCNAPVVLPTVSQEVTCVLKESIATDNVMLAKLPLDTGTLPEGAPVSVDVNINGGGAPDAADSNFTSIDSFNDAPFDFLPGQNGAGVMITGGDGLPANQAGSHPGTFSTETAWPLGKGNLPDPCCYGNGSVVATDGGIKDVDVHTPPGFILNPRALKRTCNEAQLEQYSCPDESAVGQIDSQVSLFGLTAGSTPLYALDAPYGSATTFGFCVGCLAVFGHIDGGVTEDGQYVLRAGTQDILSHFGVPIIGFRLHFWSDPTDPIHDFSRGGCIENPKPNGCPAENRQTIPLFSMPTACSGSMPVEAYSDSWGHPSDIKHRSTEVLDSVGNPSGVTGCNALDFSPSIEARPTTNIADAPSGLDVDLKVPQNDNFNTLATAHVKKTVVKLPPGLVINPAGGNGLVGCSSAQIGIDPGTGEPDGNQPTCPDASRVGSAEVTTPLLENVLPGSVYLAVPHDNPFDSLMALYVVVEDPESGTLIKIPGVVEPDPVTGQVTTTFDNQPQLPYSDLKLHIFGGATGVLRTPDVCGTYTTNADLTPWSSVTPVNRTDAYQISSASNGGACPTTDAGRSNNPSFDAGSLTPVAGAYSPLVANLRRADGTQQFSSVSITAPPGLLGKVAGIPYCPDSALAAAAAKTGNQEKAGASCPAASEVGTVDVGTGAGPAPFFTQGHAYLTGPYKGAPLGLAIVTPAVAGPFDLGTVVTRAAFHINPDTAQVTAISDPLPTILDGIPLDIRSVQVKLGRPNFTINPTNCDPMAFTGQVVSTLGQPASLLSRYQLAECVNLGFKPKLSLRLKGGTKRLSNPGLVATLTAREGDANIAKARVRLPSIAFLDNSHIGTVCSRVQFAANQCPPDSVYGSAEATTPLVDYVAKGSVYLRANPEHELPDLVAALKGPDSQPIEIDLAGTTDSVHSALRNTFEAVPDVPVTSFHLELLSGKKGLIELSKNLCKKRYRASIELEGQNGKVADSSPVVASECKGKPKPKHRRHHHRRHGSRAH
jgi:hypothetical protein